MESAVVDRRAGRMSGAEFRAFQDKRPDHERWELLGGVPMMMTPPTLSHNQIATNLQRLLNDALEQYAPSMLAAQRPGLELASGDYKPEPDVAVIDADFGAGQRFVEKAYLLAEIISGTDDIPVPGTNRRWVDAKRDLYRAHDHCQAVLNVSQDRMDVELDLRACESIGFCVLRHESNQGLRSRENLKNRIDSQTLRMENGWAASVLQDGGAELSIPAFGFKCVVAQLYDKTPLALRPTSRRRP